MILPTSVFSLSRAPWLALLYCLGVVGISRADELLEGSAPPLEEAKALQEEGSTLIDSPLAAPALAPVDEKPMQVGPSLWWDVAFWVAFHLVQSLGAWLLLSSSKPTSNQIKKNVRTVSRVTLPLAFVWQVVMKSCLTLLGPSQALRFRQAGRGFWAMASIECLLPWLIAMVFGGLAGSPDKAADDRAVSFFVHALGAGLIAPLLYSVMRVYYQPEPEEDLAHQEGQEPQELATQPPWAGWHLAFWIAFHFIQAAGLILLVGYFRDEAILKDNDDDFENIVSWCLSLGVVQVVCKAAATLLGPAPPLPITEPHLGLHSLAAVELLLPWASYLFGAWGRIFFPRNIRPEASWPYGHSAFGYECAVAVQIVMLLSPWLYSFLRQYYPGQVTGRKATLPPTDEEEPEGKKEGEKEPLSPGEAQSAVAA